MRFFVYCAFLAHALMYTYATFSACIIIIYIYIYISGFVLLSQVLDVTPSNVKSLAGHISPSADIQETVIHFRPGTSNELLLSIPLLGFSGCDPTIVIELGIDNEYPNKWDHDLRVGVSDGRVSNLFYIVDKNNYHSSPPCYPIVPNRDDTRVTGKVPRTFKMTIVLQEQYGNCETAHDGGYSNVGKFENKLDLSRLLYFQLIRHDAAENYYIRYISIERK